MGLGIIGGPEDFLAMPDFPALVKFSSGSGCRSSWVFSGIKTCYLALAQLIILLAGNLVVFFEIHAGMHHREVSDPARPWGRGRTREGGG
ncbi:hypothetical protein, partial [Pseudomonas oryzihabitans]|uniref:hypothetical protein n=1 Tax=Pseudomonas oryzihabitans TaxID=47885 RepID=UPI001E59E855